MGQRVDFTLMRNTWGAPLICSELLMLGFTEISEATVSRYLQKFRSTHLTEEYLETYNKDRSHLFLVRDSPLDRKVQERLFESSNAK